MKVYSNNKLIKRNHMLGNVFSIGALVILAIGFFLPGGDSSIPRSILALVCLIVGFISFQVGNYFVNRWGKSPRPDEILTQSLKGLDDKYSLYHYETPISHLLVGPPGVIALLPYGQNGTLIFDPKKKEWKQHGGNIFLKFFGQEGLGKPNAEALIEQRDLKGFLERNELNTEMTKPEVLLVFTNTKAEIQGEGSAIPFVTAAKLKDYIRKKAKECNLNSDVINTKLQK